MNYNDFYKKYLVPYQNLDFVFLPDEGFIVWRIGTGENAELLHIRTFHKKKGIGKKLVLSMIDKLKYQKPYHSIFGFTRVDNIEAQRFYSALGFNIEHVNGIYKDGQCKLFWASYDELYDKYFGDNK